MQKVWAHPIKYCAECPYFHVGEDNKGHCSPLDSGNETEIDIEIDPCKIHPDCPLDNWEFDEKGNMEITFLSEMILWEREQQKKKE